jgi:hypothetical protein
MNIDEKNGKAIAGTFKGSFFTNQINLAGLIAKTFRNDSICSPKDTS